jgi:NTP pyrophosphatase (non-canonical NTP hydrolase)
MTLNEYQERAASTAVYKNAEAKDIPGSFRTNVNSLAYLALGLGEAGEVQGKVKKFLRGDNMIGLEDSIIYELGDLLWHISEMSRELGYTLNEVANKNLLRLKVRKGRNTLNSLGDER